MSERVRRGVVERPGAAPVACDFQGRLENFSPAAVLRLLANERKTGVLWLHRHAERVRVMFRAGEPVRTECSHDITVDWRDCLTAVLGWGGRIDGLVNNAGGQFPARLRDLSLNGWNAVVANNMTATFLVSREVYLGSGATTVTVRCRPVAPAAACASPRSSNAPECRCGRPAAGRCG